MNLITRRERFWGILAGDKCVYPGSVFDPISARIVEDLGFEVGMFAGSVANRACDIGMVPVLRLDWIMPSLC
jgi:carboxyvinyl-carboxyphosphonate phosphorylmutase